MKAGFYDPYLDTIGGGERYTLTLAEYLSGDNWQVDLFWDEYSLKEKIESRLNLDLSRVNFVYNPSKLLTKWQMVRKYDLFFWVSDGSIPLLFSKNNILHFQVPFRNVGGRSFRNQLKLKKINHVVCNSRFTKEFVDQEYNVKSLVIYPPVNTNEFKIAKKEKIILSVGRFSQLLQAKRQDVLITVFKKMVDGGLKDWKLVLAGGTDVGGSEYLQKLKEEAVSYPIELLDSPDFTTLQRLYGRAKIFWYAAGFGIDEVKEPEKVEHFGITPVEAMAAGCIPVVMAKGGLKEVIDPGKNGFYWQDEKELIQITLDLIKNPGSFTELADNMIKSSQQFSRKRFAERFNEIIR